MTADHRVMTNDGWVAAGDLKPGQEIYILDQSGGFGEDGSEEMGQLLGWLIGDGTLNRTGWRYSPSSTGRRNWRRPSRA